MKRKVALCGLSLKTEESSYRMAMPVEKLIKATVHSFVCKVHLDNGQSVRAPSARSRKGRIFHYVINFSLLLYLQYSSMASLVLNVNNLSVSCHLSFCFDRFA